MRRTSRNMSDACTFIRIHFNILRQILQEKKKGKRNLREIQNCSDSVIEIRKEKYTCK